LGLVVVLAHTTGFSIEPLTAAKKFVITTWGAIALVLEAAGVGARPAVE